MITRSIVYTRVWPEIEPYLHLVEHGDPLDPQVRVEFLNVPDGMGQRLVMFQMPCVSCQRPMNPIRRREGDEWNRLYYGPTCDLTTRIACSRSRAATLEYERFLAWNKRPPSNQISLF